MAPDKIATAVVQLSGYIMMVIASYMIGGLWYPVFLTGLIVWMPIHWFKK